MSRVLVIEDDDGTADEIARELDRCGHGVARVATGPEGLRAAREGGYDALVVDRMLPGMEGLDVIEALRAGGVRTPALVLSALGSLNERVRGLRAGGDDYLTKPFALIELVARVDALLRRPAEPRETVLRVGAFRLDLFARTASREARPLELLPRELELLEYLLRRAGHVVTRSMLLQDVWGYRFEPRSNVVDVHMSKLRRKIDAAGETPSLFNVRGLGYRLDAPR